MRMVFAMAAALSQPTPLVLDLGGKGDLHFADKPVLFDIYGTGEAVSLSWPEGAIAFLTLDLNHNGIVDSGMELFGDATVLLAAHDQTAEDGFAALSQYDADHNGQIDRHDPVFNQLALWVDRNSDGKSQSSEISKLADHKITALNLAFKTASSTEAHAQAQPLLMGQYFVETDHGQVSRVLADIYLRLREP